MTSVEIIALVPSLAATIAATVGAIYAIITKKHVATGGPKKLSDYVIESKQVLDAIDTGVAQVVTAVNKPKADV